jgi:hypothetical protein
MLCLSYYCLFILFNGTGEKHEEQILPGRERGGESGGRDKREK